MCIRDSINAVHRPIPATSIDAVKRRCNAGMGRCQGGFCGPRVQEKMCIRDRATTEKILPGDGVATVPTFKNVSDPVPTIPPAIIPMIVNGFANTYGK